MNRLITIDKEILSGTPVISGTRVPVKNLFDYLEAGESPEQAVLREVNEELGLTGEIVQLIGNYAFTKKNQIMLAYEVTASGVITKNHELADIKLLSRDELINYDFGPLLITKNLLEDWKCINHLIRKE